MKKLDSHIFDAVIHLRNNKRQQNKSTIIQQNESTIMTLLSRKLEELNIDKEQLTDRLKRLVIYKKLENKPRNGANSYCYIRDDS